MTSQTVAHDAEDRNEPFDVEAARRAGRLFALQELCRLSKLSDDEIRGAFEAPPTARVDREGIRSQLANARRVGGAAPRRAGRAPRRARSAAAPRPAARVDSDDGPAPPAARLVNQRSALAVLGWPSRFYLEFIRRKHVPHVVVRRLHVSRVADILDALGLTPPHQVEAPGPAYSREAQVIKLQAGARKRGGR
jgi:hypothetical protein